MLLRDEADHTPCARGFQAGTPRFSITIAYTLEASYKGSGFVITACAIEICRAARGCMWITSAVIRARVRFQPISIGCIGAGRSVKSFPHNCGERLWIVDNSAHPLSSIGIFSILYLRQFERR